MQTPKFLRDLLQSNNYWNKNSAEFTTANEYLGKLYPGQLQKDATGNYTEPEYDMTYEQFLDAQKKFDDDIVDAIQEAQDDDDDEPDTESTKTIWVWHSEDDERICDDCASHDGAIFEYKDDIPEVPVHPNCRC